jgi:hypothetical protein
MGKHVAGSDLSNGISGGDPQKPAPHRMQGAGPRLSRATSNRIRGLLTQIHPALE